MVVQIQPLKFQNIWNDMEPLELDYIRNTHYHNNHDNWGELDFSHPSIFCFSFQIAVFYMSVTDSMLYG